MIHINISLKQTHKSIHLFVVLIFEMISSWRRSIAARRAAKKRGSEEVNHGNIELTVPINFCCPISLELMKDPVTLSTGITYDRTSIETWIEAGNVTCPVTNKVLRNIEPIPNHGIRKIIQDWCVENRSYGVERIPTPRVPLISHDVFEILSKIETSMLENDCEYCLEMVRKIRRYAKESERNKRCIVSNGSCRVLSATFDALSKRDFVDIDIFDEILSTLIMLMASDFDEKTKANLSTTQSLNSLLWFLRFGSLSSQRNAILALQSITSTSQEIMANLVEKEGFLEAVVKLVKEPICPKTTKASLLTMHHIISSNSAEKVMIQKLLEMGFIDILLEILVDSERSICEKSLGVLDGICAFDEGRDKANENALIIPLLVKKLLRVSDLSTQLSVSILWKLVKNDEKRVVVEAIEVGAFQKLLLVLQISCNETTKDKATEVLKRMNVIGNVECVDSLDFKNIKKPF